MPLATVATPLPPRPEERSLRFMEATVIHLPADLQAYVDAQVASGDYASRSDFMLALLREYYDDQQLRDDLMAGARSLQTGPARIADARLFADIGRYIDKLDAELDRGDPT